MTRRCLQDDLDSDSLQIGWRYSFSKATVLGLAKRKVEEPPLLSNPSNPHLKAIWISWKGSHNPGKLGFRITMVVNHVSKSWKRPSSKEIQQWLFPIPDPPVIPESVSRWWVGGLFSKTEPKRKCLGVKAHTPILTLEVFGCLLGWTHESDLSTG